MALRVAFYCPKGPACFIFTPGTINGRGVGGAEMGLITISEGLAALGHDVTVFNDCPSPGMHGPVRYASSADPTDALSTDWDAFVLVRNPPPADMVSRLRARRRIFFSCDQATVGNYATDVFPWVDHTVAISPYHKAYLVNRYGVSPERVSSVDLPVRTAEYAPETALPTKVRHRLIYCSVPDRGLQHLAHVFPYIRRVVRDAELVVTSDYTLWGEGIPPSNEAFRAMFAGMAGVRFLGKVARPKLVELQMSADILAYPNNPVDGNCELFGLSVAECQVAGAVPVISANGAFETTVIEGVLLGGNPAHADYRRGFAAAILDLFSAEDRLTAWQARLRAAALARFDPRRIATMWQPLLQP